MEQSQPLTSVIHQPSFEVKTDNFNVRQTDSNENLSRILSIEKHLYAQLQAKQQLIVKLMMRVNEGDEQCQRIGNQMAQLEAQYNQLRLSYNQLTALSNTFEVNYDTLRQQYEKVKTQCDILRSQNASLQLQLKQYYQAAKPHSIREQQTNTDSNYSQISPLINNQSPLTISPQPAFQYLSESHLSNYLQPNRKLQHSNNSKNIKRFKLHICERTVEICVRKHSQTIYKLQSISILNYKHQQLPQTYEIPKNYQIEPLKMTKTHKEQTAETQQQTEGYFAYKSRRLSESSLESSRKSQSKEKAPIYKNTKNINEPCRGQNREKQKMDTQRKTKREQAHNTQGLSLKPQQLESCRSCQFTKRTATDANTCLSDNSFLPSQQVLRDKLDTIKVWKTTQSSKNTSKYGHLPAGRIDRHNDNHQLKIDAQNSQKKPYTTSVNSKFQACHNCKPTHSCQSHQKIQERWNLQQENLNSCCCRQKNLQHCQQQNYNIQPNHLQMHYQQPVMRNKYHLQEAHQKYQQYQSNTVSEVPLASFHSEQILTSRNPNIQKQPTANNIQDWKQFCYTPIYCVAEPHPNNHRYDVSMRHGIQSNNNKTIQPLLLRDMSRQNIISNSIPTKRQIVSDPPNLKYDRTQSHQNIGLKQSSNQCLALSRLDSTQHVNTYRQISSNSMTDTIAKKCSSLLRLGR